MSTSNSNQAVCAFLGATGGTINHALAMALQAGHQCTALARTPQKLTDMLIAAGIPQSTMHSNLYIVEGDIRDAKAVTNVLSRAPHDLIVSGLGRTTLFTNVDETICQDGTASILSSLRTLKNEGKLEKTPHFIAISTTGISDRGRDIPIMFKPLYSVLLKSPHVDKKAMENMITTAVAEPDAVISAYTLVRPALFIEDKWQFGLERVRVGSEEAPRIGYTITRKEVGGWVFEKLIKGEASEWANQKPNLVAASKSELVEDWKAGKLDPELVKAYMAQKSGKSKN